MSFHESISRLKRNNKVYIHDSSIYADPKWFLFQEREKTFWENKINNTEYKPDPRRNFTPFLKHWGIDDNYFRDKTVMEIGTGPFGFFSAIAQIGEAKLPQNLLVVDSLMDYYQKFELSGLIPENAVRVQAPGEDIPVPKNTFDIILTTNTIDHVKDCNLFASEIGRLLKPGGILLFSVHTIVDFIRVFEPVIKYFDRNHPYHFTKNKISDLLNRNSFDLKSVVTVPLYREDPVPPEFNILKKCLCLIGFHLIATLYGVAVKAEN